MTPKRWWVFVCVLMMFPGLFLLAQQPTYKAGDYPAPRYPKIPKNPTIEDLMPVARAVVKRDHVGFNDYPGYAIKPGERALIMVAREYDPLVLEALQRAIREAGAKVDVLLGNDIHPNSADGSWNGDGSTEFQFFTFMEGVYKAQTGGIDRPEQVEIAKAGNYTIVLSGQGGGTPTLPPDLRGKLRWRWLPWDWTDKFMVNAANMPPELLKFVDDTAWRTLTEAVSIHAVDPEGTDITWNSNPEAWERPGAHNPGHLNTHQGIANATGVIAGTWNHTGAYPQIRAAFRNERLEGIEGGGAYGQKWRAIRDQWKDISWPGKQGPGLFTWLQEAAIGTNPKSARPKEALDRARANTWERRRAGIIHWGVGAGNTGGEEAGPSPVDAFYRQNPDTPDGHVHIHNYFLTMVLTKADGSKQTFVNKGHLTILD
ncbi:MAG: hypothetical protein HY647_13085, partial [Acidobacteria bacterium]|nr:hypothetical protein [Acidobacteriota bacterium]